MSRATRIRGAAFVAAAAFGLSGQAVAQARPKPPAPKPAPAYAFPKVQTQTLPNGLVVHVIENHALPLVAVRAVIEGGVLLDPVGKEGLFTLDTLLVRDGTTTMNGDALADAISELGASVSPSGFTTVADQLERSLSLLGDMLMHPTFPADALDRRRATLVSTMQRARRAGGDARQSDLQRRGVRRRPSARPSGDARQASRRSRPRTSCTFTPSTCFRRT